ncbi:MAG: CbbQ/NirQ/NorQ/GpvN family protein [Oligoflexia bacterium]|nr:CbbQ/NirQ/NorQ/GpvN family protein [Oligoflexia bacterium]
MKSHVAKSTYYENKNEIKIFESCFHNQVPLLLKGPTGCGKSHFVEYMADKLNRPIIKVSCNEDTNAADLLGRFLFLNGATIWQDGPVVRAVKDSAILYLDEFAEAREDVVVALHPLSDHRREVYLDKTNETVRAQKEFMLVASYNPQYQKSLKGIKPSTKQRFVALSLDYLTFEKEVEVISNQSGLAIKECANLVKLAQRIRENKDIQLDETVSTRLLIHASKLMAAGINQRVACHLAIAESLSDDLHITNAIKEFINLYI